MPGDASRTVSVSGTADLVRATRDEPGSALHFALGGIPTRTERAWLNALGSAGSEISWSGNLAPLAMASRPVSSPLGGYVISVSAPPDKALLLRDNISAIDTVTAASGFASIPVTVGTGNVRAVTGRDSAYVALRDTVGLRRVLVLGKAGWETKFLVTALEESGWRVDANISVAPSASVNQGGAVIDTATYSGVVALDESAASRAREIADFVRTGGGLVMGVAAARSAAFAALRISPPGPVPEILNTDDSVSHSSAAFATVQLTPEAVPIERRPEGVSVAARRVGFGRVVQIGYTETWRWRMQGGTAGKSEHADWWTQLLSQAVYARRWTPEQPLADAAPYANLIDIAGAAIPPVRSSSPLPAHSGQVMWLLLLFGLLLVEWASRRLRGAR